MVFGDTEPKEGEVQEEPETPPVDAEPEKSEGEEQPAEDEGEPRPEAEEPAADEDAEARPPAEKEKKVGGWQRKIAKLEKERELAQQERDYFRSQLVVQRPAETPKADKAPEEKAAEYIVSLVDQALAARETRQREQSVVTDFQRRTAEVRAKHDDFEDVVAEADIPVQSALGQVLLTSEHGPEIMYQLALDRKALARLSALPPLDAAREVGRLEAQLASSTAPAKPKPSAGRPPPAPITPVTARGPTTVKPVAQMTYEEYSAWRDGQRKR